MSESENRANTSEIPENAQDLTIFVQNLLDQMVSGNFSGSYITFIFFFCFVS